MENRLVGRCRAGWGRTEQDRAWRTEQDRTEQGKPEGEKTVSVQSFPAGEAWTGHV